MRITDIFDAVRDGTTLTLWIFIPEIRICSISMQG